MLQCFQIAWSAPKVKINEPFFLLYCSKIYGMPLTFSLLGMLGEYKPPWKKYTQKLFGEVSPPHLNCFVFPLMASWTVPFNCNTLRVLVIIVENWCINRKDEHFEEEKCIFYKYCCYIKGIRIGQCKCKYQYNHDLSFSLFYFLCNGLPLTFFQEWSSLSSCFTQQNIIQTIFLSPGCNFWF